MERYLLVQPSNYETDIFRGDQLCPEKKKFESNGYKSSCWCCTGLTIITRATEPAITKPSKTIFKDKRIGQRSNVRHTEVSNPNVAALNRMQPATISLMSLSASQNRVRIQDAFCTLFFPASSDVFYSLFQDSEPQDRTLTAAEQVRIDAADVLCLIQVALGASRRDWLQQAMKMYGRTLHRLQGAITRPKSNQAYDSLIAAVYFLIKCEAFLSTSWASPGWMQHTLAFVQLLSAGVDKGETVGFGKWCFLRFSYCYALGYGLFHKRRINYEPWVENVGSTYRLHMSSAMRVPSCLESLEAVRQKDAGPDRTRKALHSSLHLRGQLLDKLANLSTSAANLPYQRVKVSNFPHFLSTAGQAGCFFPIAFDFSDFGTAMMHRDTWVQLLILDQTILDLRRQRWYLLGDIFIKELEGLEGELERISTNLCQSIPYFSQPQIRCAGRIAIPEALHFLEQYFLKIEAPKHALWCESIREATSLGSRISRIMASYEG